MNPRSNVLSLAALSLCLFGATGCDDPISSTIKGQSQAAVDMQRIDADRQSAAEKNDLALERARIEADLERDRLDSQERLTTVQLLSAANQAAASAPAGISIGTLVVQVDEESERRRPRRPRPELEFTVQDIASDEASLTSTAAD